MKHAPHGEAAAQVLSFLAGLSGEDETASRLGLDLAGFRDLLAEMSLADLKPMPVAVRSDLATTFLDMHAQKFDAPTYDMAVEAARSSGSPIGFQFPARPLFDLPPPVGGTMPDGIIAHVGRCGSTLLCNMLARSGGWTSLREPEFLNRLVLTRAAAATGKEREKIDLLIERLLACLAHGVRPDRCVVKLSSWSTAPLSGLLVRRADLRVVIVVRDPLATVASFLAEPPHWSGVSPRDAAPRCKVNDARLFAEAWASVIRTSLLLPRERVLFLNYENMVHDPLAALARVRQHFGDTAPIAQECAITAALTSYSKGEGSERFDPDGRHRRAALEGDLRDIVTAATYSGWGAVRALAA